MCAVRISVHLNGHTPTVCANMFSDILALCMYIWAERIPLLFDIYTLNVYEWSRDSVVGIATSYGLDDRGVGVRVPVGSRIFSFPDRPDRL
jgi:hypothetical protein